MRLRSMICLGTALAVAMGSAAACKSSSSGNNNGGNNGGGGGGGSSTLVISTDLPMQGASADASNSEVDAVKLYLDQVGNKAGKYKIQLKIYDDSTAAAGKWDEAQCKKNAADHLANTNEVAVMGTYNSGCAKLEIPVLNKGPMLMVSNANTYPGLTKPWDQGEPDIYYPTGKRNYARVITTDDYQGTAAARFASADLHVKKCAILNDNEAYGQGVAKAFQTEAQKLGITVISNQPWDAKASSYASVFQALKSSSPDCVYLGGIFDNNGAQLIKDKVAVLGDNQKVKLLAPDGFTGYPQEDKMPQAQGEYLTFAGLTTTELIKNGGAAAKLINAYKAKYGSMPATNYALYAVAATQVILAAIEKSDGTRQGVVNAVFSGDGITIPAEQSVLGKEFHIDPQTGDVNVHNVSIEIMKANQEQFFKAQPLD